jgi:hypothetical protein
MQFYSADKAYPKYRLINLLQPSISLPGKRDVIYNLINNKNTSHTNNNRDFTSASITSITSKVFVVTKLSRVTNISNTAPTKYDRW